MAAKKYVQALTQYLAGSGVIVGATSIVLTSLTDIYGNAITGISSFGDKGYITLEPDSVNEEAATFTGITVNANGTVTLTGVSTALAQSPYTESSGLIRAHSGGTKLVITDNVAFWNTFGNKNNDEALIGRWTTPVAPLNANDIVNKTYADGLAIAGAPDSTTAVKGIGRVSVAPVSPTIPIFVGDNDTRVPTIAQTASLVGNNTDIAVGSGNKMVTQTGLQHSAENYAADSGVADAMVVTLSPIPTSYTSGMIIRTKAAATNLTATPTVNVNGLGAKTIKKNGTAALVASDILINQVITLVYDGSAFQMQNPPALTPPISSVTKMGVTTRAGNTASGSQTIAHGVGKTPTYIRITATIIANSANTVDMSVGTYNGSTTATVFFGQATGNIAGTDTTNIVILEDSGSNAQNATATFDGTNITLTWTKVGTGAGAASGNNMNLLWEAFA